MHPTGYPAIYDFALLPYALGDVLTWNVQTAIRAIQLNKKHVDIHICVDRKRPASIFQQDLIHQGNYNLHFHELLPAFNTHPMLRHLKIYSDRVSMFQELDALRGVSADIDEDIDQYKTTTAPGVSQEVRLAYFLKFIYSHRQLNDWGRDHGHIPLLVAPRCYEEDVKHLQKSHFKGRRPVVIHFRLRRLDLGMGGGHTYARDADFMEWHHFLRAAAQKHPEVHFVVVGRLPEKPLAVLRLPNVTSLRTLGMNLGHELALISCCDLFLGSSSGFAAMANFTTVPYFITKMGKSPCDAYEIPLGEKRLPFALPNQVLVYEEETSELLMSLLEEGLRLPTRQSGSSVEAETPSVPSVSDCALIDEYNDLNLEDSSTHRYYLDDGQCDAEVMHLLQRDLDSVSEQIENCEWESAKSQLDRLHKHFPRSTIRSGRYHALRGMVEEAAGRIDEAEKHRVWSLILDQSSSSPPGEQIEFAAMRSPAFFAKLCRKAFEGSNFRTRMSGVFRLLIGR